MLRWPLLKPRMAFYPGAELHGDPTNWWSPNKACMLAMLRDVGLGHIVFSRPDWRYRRGMFHCWAAPAALSGQLDGSFAPPSAPQPAPCPSAGQRAP